MRGWGGQGTGECACWTRVLGSVHLKYRRTCFSCGGFARCTCRVVLVGTIWVQNIVQAWWQRIRHAFFGMSSQPCPQCVACVLAWVLAVMQTLMMLLCELLVSFVM